MINFFLTNTANSVDTLGLIFDISGVIILFFYGLPSRINTPPKLLLEADLTKEELEENKKIKFWANIGLYLIAVGFILQLISQWIK